MCYLVPCNFLVLTLVLTFDFLFGFQVQQDWHTVQQSRVEYWTGLNYLCLILFAVYGIWKLKICELNTLLRAGH